MWFHWWIFCVRNIGLLILLLKYIKQITIFWPCIYNTYRNQKNTFSMPNLNLTTLKTDEFKIEPLVLKKEKQNDRINWAIKKNLSFCYKYYTFPLKPGRVTLHFTHFILVLRPSVSKVANKSSAGSIFCSTEIVSSLSWGIFFYIFGGNSLGMRSWGRWHFHLVLNVFWNSFLMILKYGIDSDFSILGVRERKVCLPANTYSAYLPGQQSASTLSRLAKPFTTMAYKPHVLIWVAQHLNAWEF